MDHTLLGNTGLACHVRMSPADLGLEQLRDYLNRAMLQQIKAEITVESGASARACFTVLA